MSIFGYTAVTLCVLAASMALTRLDLNICSGCKCCGA